MKTKQRTTLGLLLILMLVGLGVFVLYEMTLPTVHATGKGPPTTVNSGSGGSSTSGSTATIWQTLYIIDQDGSKYWVNAPQPFTAGDIAGSPSGSGNDFTAVSSMQNNIYMNLAESGVTAWAFSCQETITLDTTTGNTIATIASATTVNANGNTAAQGQNIWVTGATVTAAQLQNIFNQATSGSISAGNYYVVISLSNIDLTLTINGQPTTLTAQTGTAQNVLSWLVQIS
jgi:hypothetical protein